MNAKHMMIAIGTLLMSAAAAAPASAGDRRIEVELGRGGIEIHADFRRERDRHEGRQEHRRDRGRRGHDDRGRRGHDDHGRRGHEDCCRFVPGHFETRNTRVWVPGYIREEYVPPLYETRYDRHGRCYRVLVREGYVRRIVVPGRFEVRLERVWVPGRIECRR